MVFLFDTWVLGAGTELLESPLELMGLLFNGRKNAPFLIVVLCVVV